MEQFSGAFPDANVAYDIFKNNKHMKKNTATARGNLQVDLLF